MSEEHEEERSKTGKLVNRINGEEFTINVQEKDMQKLKEFMEDANKLAEQNQQLNEEINTLKSVNPPKAPISPEGSTAPLNYAQTGQEPNSNEGLEDYPDMMQFKDEQDMISQLEKLANSGNVGAKKSLQQLLAKSTEKSWEFEFDGTGKDLFRKTVGTEQQKEQIRERKKQWRRVR